MLALLFPSLALFSPVLHLLIYFFLLLPSACSLLLLFLFLLTNLGLDCVLYMSLLTFGSVVSPLPFPLPLPSHLHVLNLTKMKIFFPYTILSEILFNAKIAYTTLSEVDTKIERWDSSLWSLKMHWLLNSCLWRNYGVLPPLLASPNICISFPTNCFSLPSVYMCCAFSKTVKKISIINLQSVYQCWLFIPSFGSLCNKSVAINCMI